MQVTSILFLERMSPISFCVSSSSVTHAKPGLATRVAPHTDMNPVLLKPYSDTEAQVIIHGKIRAAMNARDYHHHKTVAMRAVLESYARLRNNYSAIVVEDAGSPRPKSTCAIGLSVS